MPELQSQCALAGGDRLVLAALGGMHPRVLSLPPREMEARLAVLQGRVPSSQAP